MAVWEWPCSTISRVIDGDTVDALLTRDLGFGGRAVLPVRLRLARINTARSTTTKGRQATARVIEQIIGVAVHITTIKAYKYGGPDDMMGEYMAEIGLPDGRNLSDLLVAEGLAVFWSGSGPRPADI